MSFKPTDLKNCCLWLDATQITGYSNNQTISKLTDLSGSCSSISVSAINYIASGINNKPSLYFNGSSSYAYLGSYLGSSLINCSVFLVYKAYNGGNTWQRIISCHDKEDYVTNSLYTCPDWDVNGHNNNFNTKLTVLKANRYCDVFYLARNPYYSEWFYGLISELIIYKRQTTNYEDNAICSYLQSKYGLTSTYKYYRFMIQDGNNLDVVNNDTNDLIIKDTIPITFASIDSNGMYFPPNVNNTVTSKLYNNKYKIALYKK